MTNKLNQLGKLVATCSFALAALLLTSPVQTANAQGCATGLGSSIQLDKSVAHIGDTVTITLTRVSTAQGDCNVNSLVGWIIYPNNTAALSMTNVTLTSPQTFTCVGPSGGSCVAGVNYSYVIQAADMGRNLSFDTPLGNSCVRAGSVNTVRFLFAAEGIAETTPVTSTAFACNNAPVTVITPGIACQKFCSNGVGENGQITFSGFVTNTGNTILNGVIVSNLVNGTMTLVTNIATLNVGQSVAFGGSYVPANPCVPTQDTIFVRGTDTLGLTVTSECSATCQNIITPCIDVTKNCTGPVLPGANQVISGVVSNCGNVTLTNIVISDNILGGVTNIATLAPGAAVGYSRTFTAGCVGNTNIVTATATSRCGQNVSDTATAVCPVTFTPCLQVTKNCDTVVIGQLNTVSGFVTNCGNITITNIVISDNIYGAITTIPTLAPGASASYSKSVSNLCGSFPNTVTAAGTTICGGPIQATATATCVVTENPCIRVTKLCDTVVVGQANLVTAIVTNCGNVPLHGITVTDNIYGSVGTIALLAPGGTATLTKSVTNTCGNFPNTVTATGLSPCNTSVQATSTATCAVTENPCIRVTKLCDTVVVGQANLVTAIVTNCGNVPLHGITVTDNIYGSVGTIALLAPGGTATLTKLVTNSCGSFPNTVTATGLSPCNTSVQATSTATCVVTENPCIGVTKSCNTVNAGQANLVTAVVTNCGNVPLHGITVTDNIYGSVGTIALLAPGGTATLTKSVTNTCGNFPNTVTATGLSPCNTSVQATSTATCIVICEPQICVTKEVVCELPTGCATNWSDLAIGVKNGDDCPSFCYRIRVTNCGKEDLRDVTVTDPDISLAACNFPPTLAVGQTVECIVSGVELCDDLVNTVTAVGVGVISGIRTNDTDSAEIKVREISITCETTVNGEHFIEIPCDGQPHLVTNEVRVCNTGDLPLSNISIFAPNLIALGGACADVSNLRFSLGVGECTNIVLCVDAPVCEPSCGIAFSNFVHIVAHVDLSKTNVCIWTRNETNGIVEIVAETECEAVVGCVPPNACRVTGGGRQDDPLAYPHNVRYVTHGGQVGAPVGNKVCEVTDDFYLGNPCIHGRWTHVRHQQGGLRGNFHARYYDTLDCMCLDTNTTSQPSGFGYNNLVYGAGTVEDQVCNKDDHKVAGPQPRPAPANKIVFTGVGDWADPNGRRAPRACLFRVDIEDRSEPGGSHPRGGVDPADRYRIRIWVLDNTELANLRGAGSGATKYLKGFRTAIGACNGLNVVDGATVPNGAAAFGVRAPDVDDGGELERGNHQIHPAIKNCDPYNPTGPGLPPGGN